MRLASASTKSCPLYLCSMLLHTCMYAKNYVGIIDPGLVLVSAHHYCTAIMHWKRNESETYSSLMLLGAILILY